MLLTIAPSLILGWLDFTTWPMARPSMGLPTSKEGAYDLRSLMRPRMYGSTDTHRLRTST